MFLDVGENAVLKELIHVLFLCSSNYSLFETITCKLAQFAHVKHQLNGVERDLRIASEFA